MIRVYRAVTVAMTILIVSTRSIGLSFQLPIRYLRKFSCLAMHYPACTYNLDLANRLKIPYKSTDPLLEEGLMLNYFDNALFIEWGKSSLFKLESPFKIDFTSKQLLNRAKSSRSELACKAMGTHVSSIYDLTAGLGRDSFLLATGLRKSVTMFEKNYVLYLLLEDGVRRLKESNSEVGNLLKVVYGDCTSKEFDQYFQENISNIGIYLDPMYPDGSIGDKSLVKKETQILRRLTQGEETVDGDYKLFRRSMSINGVIKVVVKRPIKGDPIYPYLTPSKILGSTQRFDVYFPKIHKFDMINET